MKKKLNVLYFHGLGGGYSEFIEKVILGYIGEDSELIYPTLDYEALHSSNINPVEVYSKLNHIDLVIGNSMGGFVGYQVAKRLNVPCLLFNPALYVTTNSFMMFGVGLEEVEDKGNLNVVVIGKYDNIVSPIYSLEWIENNIKNKNVIAENVGHSVPPKIFKKNYKNFIDILGQ
jgi:hypothetical protein